MQNQGIRDARSLGTPKMLVLGLQHMFAMFGATVLVPALTGLSVSATLLFAGLGTLFFHFLTKGKVPAFLGSSFAYLAGYAAIAPNGETALLPYACVGVAASGLLYLILSALVRGFGANRVMRFFPMLLGELVSYVYAAIIGRVDFSGVANAAWIGLPVKMENTVFSLIGNCDMNLLVTAVIAIMPIAFATMIEHIGDICAISSTVGENFIADPGLHRTLLGDGLATTIASLFGAPANTTYGENTGVLALTRVYDPLVIRLAAVYAIIASFCPKFAALVSAMPTGTIGGVSLILYGMISAIGVRNLVENQVDLSKSRNVIVVSLIISLALGITFSAAGAITFHIGEFTLNFSGLAVAAIVGIVVNAILPGKDYDFQNNYEYGKTTEDHGQML